MTSMAEAAMIAAQCDNITYPSPSSAKHVRSVVRWLLAEIGRLRLDARAYANVELSEENDRLIDENKNLQDALDCALRDCDTVSGEG